MVRRCIVKKPQELGGYGPRWTVAPQGEKNLGYYTLLWRHTDLCCYLRLFATKEDRLPLICITNETRVSLSGFGVCGTNFVCC